MIVFPFGKGNNHTRMIVFSLTIIHTLRHLFPYLTFDDEEDNFFFDFDLVNHTEKNLYNLLDEEFDIVISKLTDFEYH